MRQLVVQEEEAVVEAEMEMAAQLDPAAIMAMGTSAPAATTGGLQFNVLYEPRV